MLFKWQEKHIELFLETYQQHECLWNTRCSDYNKSSAREKAYSSMLIALNLPGLTIADIKAKIKTIRTRYVSELAKIRNSEKNGADADDVYAPRLFWFKDADVFLRNVCTPKASFSILKDSDSSTVKETPATATNDSQNSEKHSEKSVQQTAEIKDTEERRSPCNMGNVHWSTPNNSANCKRVRKRSFNSCVSGVQNAIKQLKGISNESKEDPNEFDVFCSSLAIQLKKMPLNRALLCQQKLQNVMTEERLFQLTNTRSHLSMASSSTMSSPTHSYHSEQ